MSATNTPNLGLTYLTSGQLQPEVTINNDLNILDNAVAAAAAFSNNPLTTSGLNYGYLGGNIYQNGVNTAIVSGTVYLTASTTNYVQRTVLGVVSTNTTGFTTGLIPMATVVTGASSITTITDNRPSAYIQSAAIAQTSVTGTSGGILAAANLIGSANVYLTRSGPTAAFTDTTDTAANIIAALFPGIPTGTAWIVRMLNNTGFVQTIAAGSGVTLGGINGTTIAANSWRDYVLTMTSATAITMNAVGSGAN